MSDPLACSYCGAASTDTSVPPCCQACTAALASMGEEEFFAWVARVYARLWETLETKGRAEGSIY